MKILDEIMDAMGIVDEVEEEVPHKSVEERNAARAERAEKKQKSVETEEEPKESTTDKLKNFFKKKDEPEDEEAPEEEKKATTGKRRLNFNFTKKQDGEATEQAAKPENVPKSVEKTKASEPARHTPVLPFNAGEINMQLIKPTSFDDSQKIADCLHENQPVIINFENTDPIIAKRMTDFISGTIYALQGNMKKIGRNILICAPKNIDIDSEFLLEDRGREPWQE